jgi:hypothetical protein
MATRLPLEQKFGVRVPGPQCKQLLPCGAVSTGRAFLLLAGLLAAIALLGAGCGGDDSTPAEPVQDVGDNQSQTALSKNELIAQGDAICGEANAALSALDASTVESDPEVQATQELEITRSELQSLQSLTPPSQSRSVLERFLSALQDQVDALSRRQAAVEQGDDPASAEAEVSSAAASAQAAAQDYGFADCANASETPPPDGTATAPPVATTTPTTIPPTVPTTPATGDPGAAGGGTGVGGTGGGTGGGSGGGGSGGGDGGTGGTGGGISP